MKPEIARSIINKGGLLDKEKVSALLDYIESADRKIEQLTADRQGFKELSASYATEIGAKDSIIASRDFDIQQLNEQVRALAAEVAAVKDGAEKCQDDIAAIYDTNGWYVSEDGESNTAVIDLEGAQSVVRENILDVATPATDAILNEVRAQAAERMAASEEFSTWVQQALIAWANRFRRDVDGEYSASTRNGEQS